MAAERGNRDAATTTLLDQLVVSCPRILSVTGAVIAVTGGGQHRGAVAASDPLAADADDLQFSLGEGPCIDAGDAAEPVLAPDLVASTGRWPAYAPAALALGIAAVFALPLRVGTVRLGVLSLYRDRPGPLDPKQLGEADSLSRLATNLLTELQAERPPGVLPDRLEEVLSHRATVHQATGMVAAQLDTSVGMALGRLRAHAWAHGLTIDAVAEAVVNGRLRFGGDATEWRT